MVVCFSWEDSVGDGEQDKKARQKICLPGAGGHPGGLVGPAQPSSPGKLSPFKVNSHAH